MYCVKWYIISRWQLKSWPAWNKVTVLGGYRSHSRYRFQLQLTFYQTSSYRTYRRWEATSVTVRSGYGVQAPPRHIQHSGHTTPTRFIAVQFTSSISCYRLAVVNLPRRVTWERDKHWTRTNSSEALIYCTTSLNTRVFTVPQRQRWTTSPSEISFPKDPPPAVDSVVRIT